MKYLKLYAILLSLLSVNIYSESSSKISFQPINHASLIMKVADFTIYIDTVGEEKNYTNLKGPDLILITHTHKDHLNNTLLNALKDKDTRLIGPRSVIDQTGWGEVLTEGEKIIINKINIDAIPAYNTTPSRLKYHPRGEGIGYVITANDVRTYISGDTEDIPEMLDLKKIDYAFICMNLPYTMSVEQAASAVLKFKPGTTFPYHYRGKGGFSDVKVFKKLVSKNKKLKVRILNWY